MYAQTKAQAGYGATLSAVRSDRSAEYSIFAKITARLSYAAQQADTHFQDVASAIADNRKLWTHLAGDVADPDNALPDALRAQIFYLGEFVTHHSRLALRNEADIAPLIEINKTIMRGLSNTAAEPTA